VLVVLDDAASEAQVLPLIPGVAGCGVLITSRRRADGARPARAHRYGPDNIELPDERYEVLKDVVAALSQGLAITVAPQHTVLTTGQAADLLGVSRPTLVRLFEGEIPFDKPGRHRRIRLGDLLPTSSVLAALALRDSTRFRPDGHAEHE
jgi:excisionase family DNA binding protein